MKTYSVCIRVAKGYWVTNIFKYFELSEIDWNKVKGYCIEVKALGYGYMYGYNSNELFSFRCRTVLWQS